MNPRKFRWAALAITGLSLAAVGFTGWQHAVAKRALAAVAREHEELKGRLARLETRLGAEQERVRVAEGDNVRLLQAVESAAARRAAPKTTWEPTTSATVQARMKHAQERAEAGDPAGALRAYLWCYDTGFPLLNNTGGQALNAIVKLGGQFPPAIEALRERRDQAMQRILTGAAVLDDALELDRLSRALKEEAHMIAFYDGLPPNDPRWREMGRVVFEPLVELRRYRDALEALPYEVMLQIVTPPARLVQPDTEEQRAARAKAQEAQRVAIGGIIAIEANPLNAEQLEARRAQQKLAGERAIQAMRNAIILPSSQFIEVLAGAGDIDRARELMGKLLAFDNSEATRALLRKHLERAGRPELLP